MSKFIFDFEGLVTLTIPGELTLTNESQAADGIIRVIEKALLDHYTKIAGFESVESDVSVTNIMSIIGDF